MNKLVFSLVFAASFLSTGAGAMAATNPAACYAAKMVSINQARLNAVGACNATAGQSLGKLGAIVQNARMRGIPSYSAFRSAVAALGVSVPAAAPSELLSSPAWAGYVNRVNALATAAINAKYNQCVTAANNTFNASSAAAKATCRA